jgi:hypothetical protein
MLSPRVSSMRWKSWNRVAAGAPEGRVEPGQVLLVTGFRPLVGWYRPAIMSFSRTENLILRR